MLSFLLDEGVLTVGVLSGLFTTGLLNSFKLNIIDPCIEKIIPTHKLDTDSFTSMFPIPVGTPEDNKLPIVCSPEQLCKCFKICGGIL